MERELLEEPAEEKKLFKKFYLAGLRSLIAIQAFHSCISKANSKLNDTKQSRRTTLSFHLSVDVNNTQANENLKST